MRHTGLRDKVTVQGEDARSRVWPSGRRHTASGPSEPVPLKTALQQAIALAQHVIEREHMGRWRLLAPPHDAPGMPHPS